MLLIDRKIPGSCIDCVCNNDDYRCNMTGDELDYDVAWTGRMPNCPLKEEERKTGRTVYQAGYAEGYKKGKQDYSRGCTGCKWEDMNGIGCSQCARRYIDQFEPMEVERP